MERFFLSGKCSCVNTSIHEHEVSKAEYVQAEREAGFHNTMGQPKEPGTASFSNGLISGRTFSQSFVKGGSPMQPIEVVAWTLYQISQGTVTFTPNIPAQFYEHAGRIINDLKSSGYAVRPVHDSDKDGE